MRLFCFVTDNKIIKIKAHSEFEARMEFGRLYPKLVANEVIVKGRVVNQG